MAGVGNAAMTLDDIMYLGRDAMMVTLLVSAPMLLVGLLVGLVISLLQAVTQIQEITLTFVPKIVAVMLSFIVFLPWIVATLMNFIQPLFGDLDRLAR